MATIQQQNSIYYIDIRYSGHQTLPNIDCWLPLKDMEPVNKKHKTGNSLAFRTPQGDRGGYFQMSNGSDVHVYMYNQNAPVVHVVQNMIHHISHLCHHWWCCNPAHLVREPEWVNIFRKSCLLNHGGNCDCSSLNHPRYTTPIPPCIWGGNNPPDAGHMTAFAGGWRVKEINGGLLTLSDYVNNL